MENDGIPLVVEADNGKMDGTLTFLLTTILFAVGLFVGVIVSSSYDVAVFKGHYCARYNNTQQYIACKNKPMNELYQEMDKH